MNNKAKIQWKISVVILIMAVVFGAVDYHRIMNSKEPLFSHHCYSYKDGGSKIYFGFLYKITWVHLNYDARYRSDPELNILYMPFLWLGGHTYIPIVDDQILSEWRLPTENELVTDDPKWRHESPNLFLNAAADFDGDGKIDTAQLMINDKTKNMGLFITLSSLKNSQPILVYQRRKEAIKDIGIKIVNAGEYKTARAKGYGDKDEPAILTLKRSAVDYFEYNPKYKFYNGVYFVWDQRSNRFNMFWMDNWGLNNS